jgi:hypothetical protein
MLPVTEELPRGIETLVAGPDTGFAGIPYVPGQWSILNWLYILLMIAWVGMILLTGYAIKVNPTASVKEMDTDTLMVLVAWVGLLLLSAYTLRILHGP